MQNQEKLMTQTRKKMAKNPQFGPFWGHFGSIWPKFGPDFSKIGLRHLLKANLMQKQARTSMDPRERNLNTIFD